MDHRDFFRNTGFGLMSLAVSGALFSDLTWLRACCACFFFLVGVVFFLRGAKPYFFLTPASKEIHLDSSGVLVNTEIQPKIRLGISILTGIAILLASTVVGYTHYRLFGGEKSKSVISITQIAPSGIPFAKEPKPPSRKALERNGDVSTPNHKQALKSPTQATIQPSIEQNATAKQVVLWGKPLMASLSKLEEDYDKSFEMLRERRRNLSKQGASSQEIAEVDADLSSLAVRTTMGYWDCCVEDDIRYRDALLKHLPGGWRNETVYPLYEVMRDKGTRTAHSGPALIKMIVGDMQLLTNGVERPLASFSKQNLGRDIENQCDSLRAFAEPAFANLSSALNTMPNDEVKLHTQLNDEYKRRFRDELVSIRNEMDMRLDMVPPEPYLDLTYQSLTNTFSVGEIQRDLLKLYAQLPTN